MFGKKNKKDSNSINIPNNVQQTTTTTTTTQNIQADQQKQNQNKKQNKKQNKIPLRIVIGIIVIVIIGIILFSSPRKPQTIITTAIPNATTTNTITTNAINATTTTINNTTIPNATTTTTITTNAINATTTTINNTTIPNATTTNTITTNAINATTTTINNTINMSLQICSLFSFSTNKFNSTIKQKCRWNGGIIGIWGGSGDSNYLNVELNTNNKTYLNKTYINNCLDFLTNISLPANNYNLIIKTGPKNGTCGNSILILNKTIIPIYQNVYNGNFSEGYSGWNISGKGFGIAPLNINSANAKLCYLGTPWTNYDSSFFATTFNCGLSNVFGNITSNYFRVTKAFLNFKIISPQNKGLYIEILYKHKPYISIQYNTFNNSIGSDSSSTFRNATIPLETILNKVVQIKVIAKTLKDHTYIAIGDFKLSNMPNQQIGIIGNETINSSVIKS